jgi:hypothetical protein
MDDQFHAIDLCQVNPVTAAAWFQESPFPVYPPPVLIHKAERHSYPQRTLIKHAIPELECPSILTFLKYDHKLDGMISIGKHISGNVFLTKQASRWKMEG